MVLEEGAQVMAQAGAPVPTRPLGHVTSSYSAPRSAARSPWDSSPAGARAAWARRSTWPRARGEVAVEVTASVFYDPSGARINALTSRAARKSALVSETPVAALAARGRALGAARRMRRCAPPRRRPSACRCPRKPAAPVSRASARRCGWGRTSGCCWRRPTQAGLAMRLERSLAQLPHSLVDVSHRQVALARARAACGRRCSPAAARWIWTGSSSRSACARAPCSARRRWCCGARTHRQFRLEVWRSFAPYVAQYLGEAQRAASIKARHCRNWSPGRGCRAATLQIAGGTRSLPASLRRIDS